MCGDVPTLLGCSTASRHQREIRVGPSKPRGSAPERWEGGSVIRQMQTACRHDDCIVDPLSRTV